MLGIGIGLLYLLLRHVSLADITKVLSRVNPLYILIAGLAELFVTVLRTARYRWFFPTRHRRLKLYGAFALVRLITYSLPLRSGELVYVAMLKKHGFAPSIAELTPVWLLLRVTDMVALATWLSLSLTFHSIDDSYQMAKWVFAGIALSLLAGLIGMSVWGKRINVRRDDSWLSSRLRKFQKGLSRIRSWLALARTLLFSLLIWLLMAVAGMFLQIAFDSPLSFESCFVAALTTMSIGLLPIQAPLGIGTGEAIWTGVFKVLGVQTTQAIGLAIAVRLVTILFVCFEGLIGLAIMAFSSTELPNDFSSEDKASGKGKIFIYSD